MLDLSAKIKSLPLKAVLFDLDDTLYDSVPIYAVGVRNAWECFCKETKKNWTLEEFQNAYETARKKAKNLAPESPTRHSRLTYFSFLVTDHCGRPAAELTLKLDRAYTAAYRTINFSPAQQLLKSIKSKLKVAIVTNQTLDAQLHKLKALDPDSELVDCLVTSEEVAVEKPGSAIFNECLKRLQLEAHEVLMVGDHWNNDVIGACAVGIASVFLDPKTTPRVLQMAPLVVSIDSISNIAHLLRDHIS